MICPLEKENEELRERIKELEDENEALRETLRKELKN